MRPQGWESLLSGHIAEARSGTFEWGTHDCILWCAGWVRKITGSDPAQDWRGKYSSEDEAVAVLTSMGFSTWADLAAAHLPETPVALAQRGDIVLHPVNACLGICAGAHAYFVTDRGVTRVEFTKCLKAWKVD